MSTINLRVFQDEQRLWQEKNFPGNSGHSALLGLVEEVGELSHAHLKTEQGIRGTAEEHRAEAEDAIGDIMVYLAGYCNNNGYDLDGCLQRTWSTVMSRDWQANAQDGSVLVVDDPVGPPVDQEAVIRKHERMGYTLTGERLAKTAEEQLDAALEAINSGDTDGVPGLHALSIEPSVALTQDGIVGKDPSVPKTPDSVRDGITEQMRRAGILDEDAER